MVPVVVDLVVVDGQELAVVMKINAVPLVIGHLFPVSLLVAVSVNPEVVVVNVRVVNVAVDVDIFKDFVVSLVNAKRTNLVTW